MIWTLVWGASVVAALAFIFRRSPRMLAAWLIFIALAVASALLQGALEAYRGYRDFVAAIAPIGRAIVIASAIVLAADVIAMATYTLLRRHGSPRPSEDRGIQPRSAGERTFADGRRGKRFPPTRIAVGAFVSFESLIDGSATRGERMMAMGIVAALVAFFLIFVGAGLALAQYVLLAALFPVGPALWLFRILRDMRQDYRETKRRLAAQRT